MIFFVNLGDCPEPYEISDGRILLNYSKIPQYPLKLKGYETSSKEIIIVYTDINP